MYTIWPINGKGPVQKVFSWQLYDQKKSQSEASDPWDPGQNTNFSHYQPTRKLATSYHVHPYGTHSKTKNASTGITTIYL